MALNIVRFEEFMEVDHPCKSDPVFDCVQFAYSLESIGYEDAIELVDSTACVDWDYFNIVYAAYRASVNEQRKITYRLSKGLPPSHVFIPKRKKKECPVCKNKFNWTDKNGNIGKYCNRECWKKALKTTNKNENATKAIKARALHVSFRGSLYTCSELGKILNVNQATIRRRYNSGTLKCIDGYER